ncbi:arylamine N-acetyltransferase [Streptomyces sp. NBC_01794]|uniref:arylamine N-acetyltransferase family protein n=1 Tax=unclassified Streptomyces TaxID=2593676 RepID=UPI00387308F5
MERWRAGPRRVSAAHRLYGVPGGRRARPRDAAYVGFGGEGLLEPIPMRDGVEVRQGGWTFAIAREDNEVRALRALHPDGWFDLYGFTMEKRFPVDYAVMSHYTSTHPRSPFISRAVVQRTGEGVRHSLVGARLSVASPDGPGSERQIPAGEFAPDPGRCVRDRTGCGGVGRAGTGALRPRVTGATFRAVRWRGAGQVDSLHRDGPSRVRAGAAEVGGAAG